MAVTTYDTEFFAGRNEFVVASAAGVVPVVVELLSPRSVLDVGCGRGEWLEAFSESVADTFGIDIAYPEDSPSHHDLTKPLDLGRTFELVLCLEVGEHLPDSAADTLVDSVVRHSSTVLFSAAVPGQAGKGHINCQPHEYWHEKFVARGYVVNDAIRPRVVGNPWVSPWYRNNIFLYLRQFGEPS